MLRALVSLLLRLALAASLVASALASELGRPVVRNFSVRDMNNRGYQPGPAFQDREGAVYFGDWSQVAIYDGTAWEAVDVPFGRLMRGPATGPDGRVYVGGNNQLGYLRSAPYGRKEFVSLLDRLPENERDFRAINAVAALPDGVAFVAAEKVLLWRGEAFAVLAHGGARACVDVGERALYLHAPGQPLRRVERGEFVSVTDDARAVQSQIVWVQRESSGALLIGTSDRGLFRLSEGSISPLRTDLDALWAEAKLECALRLPDGSLALALQGRGLFFLDAAGRLLTTLNEANGLLPRGNQVRGLFADREGGLWISHGAGVSRAEWPNAITVFDQLNGAKNLPLRAVQRVSDALCISGVGGVYRLVAGRGAAPAQFEFVPGSQDVRNVLEFGRAVLGATADALLELRPEGFAPVLKFHRAAPAAPVILTRSLREPTRIWIGAPDGLRSVRRTAQGWIDEGKVSGVDHFIVQVLELPDGTLWLRKAVDGFMRVRFASGADSRGDARVDDFPGGHGLPPKLAANNDVVLWRDQPLFVTDYSVFTWDEAANRFQLFNEFGPRLNEQPLIISGLRPSRDGGLWVAGTLSPPGAGEHRARRLYRVSPRGEWQQARHFLFDAVHVPAFYGLWEEHSEAGHVLWVAGSQGVARIDVARAFAPLPAVATRLVAEAIHDGQTWSDHVPRRDATDPRNPPVPSVTDPPLDVTAHAEIPARFASLRFRYAALTQAHGAELRYQTRLEGFENTWSSWGAETSRIFTSLPAGRYVFRVRGESSDGHLSEPAELAFTVLPPWWLTRWAYAGYGLAAIFGVAAIVRFRSRQLRRANERLEALVAERTEELRSNEAQLRIARDGAEAANRAKSAFLANMSHELRTPLNAVLGYAQIVLRDPALPAEHRRRVQAIVQGGDHLLKMINDVLDLSKIEADKVELAPRSVSLPRLLAALSEMFQLRATERGIAFGFRQITPLPGNVLADESRLRQVLINLLENAVKFTPAAGRVDLEVGRAGERIHFGVRDTGTGIAADQLHAIFRPFHQATVPSLAQQGAGLGLAISQRLVGLMGGAIQVESELGRGSHFWFEVTLPETAANGSADPFGGPFVTGYRGTPRRALVVDDEATNRQVLREMLEPLGFACSEAVDGESAVAAATAAPPDVVLMDIRMPGLDGLGAARRLRGQTATAGVKIVAVSASVFASDREEAIAHGCDEFLPKPFREAQLVDALGRVLDIKWVHAPTASVPRAQAADAVSAGAREVPGPDDLAALATLAEEGDVVALRARLADLRERAPRCAAFVAKLDALAAEFQMTRVSEAIARARRS